MQQYSLKAIELNNTLRKMQLNCKEWNCYKHTVKIHKWIEIMNQDFFNNMLPLPFLTIRRTARSFGHFTPSYNHVGAKYEINLNPKYFDPYPEIEMAHTALHEKE